VQQGVTRLCTVWTYRLDGQGWGCAQRSGIRIKRDSLVSVMYSTELNSITSLVTPQRTDPYGILDEKPPDFQLFS
jgi:hypothetical protein